MLSGGGAKGFAHIGVIRQLETIGVYPDVITGTSMGSIVGALYAMGYTPDEMEQIVREQDWDRVLSNSLHYNKVVMNEKEYDSRYFLEVGIEKGNVKFPQGLIHGKELAILLDKITIPAHSIKDFTKFPIPFACVATDITTGEPVVMKSGNINEAIRASMAIPSVFTPVKYDGHLCVDGGIVRNFPVQEALDMGADIIIGSYVSGGFLQEDELNSIIDVLFQTTTVMGNFDSEEQKKLVDILIEPNVQRISGADFDRGEEIIAKGDSVVNIHHEEILEKLEYLGVDLHKIQPPKSLVKDSVFLIDNIEMTGNSTISDKSVQKHLHFSTQKKYTTSQISDHMTKLYGTKYFSQLHYTVERHSDTSYALKIKVKEDYNTQLKVAAHYDTENGIGCNANLTLRNVVFPFTRWETELDIANHMRLKTQYQFFIGKRQRNSFNITGIWQEYELPLYKEDIRYSIFETNRLEARIGAQRALSINTIIGVNGGIFYFNLKPEIAQDQFQNLHEMNIYSPFIRLFYEHNNTNHRYFPTRGGDFRVSLNYSRWIDSETIVNDTVNNKRVSNTSLRR